MAPFDWQTSTAPFATEQGGQPANVRLRQVNDHEFRLDEPIDFAPPGGGDRVLITDAHLGPTDLASIPDILGWFVRRHGRHTPAALVHDQRLRVLRLSPAAERPALRTAADLEFRRTLRASEVPPVRAWVMWTGVTLLTRLTTYRPWGRLGILAWALAAVAGTAALVYGLVSGPWWLALVALGAPFPGAVLWGRQWKAGLVAGYAFWIVLLGSIPSRVAYWIYKLTEYIFLSFAKPLGMEAQPPPPHSER